MGTVTVDPAQSAQWSALSAHARDLTARGVRLRHLFADDADRGGRCTTQVGDLWIDWSRHLVTDQTLRLLAALADQAGLRERLSAMLQGRVVNTTEGREALHTALRAGVEPHHSPNGSRSARDDRRQAGSGAAAADQEPAAAAAARAARAAAAERRRMAVFADAVRVGERLGSSGEPIRALVSLGIGGSNLGPAMACEALAAFAHQSIECRFVSNVDPAELACALSGLDPAQTLFVVVSKSFKTAETLANASAAKSWIESSLGAGAARQHFAAVTANPQAAHEFGVAAENSFAMWDWVGGRFSLASAASLALMVAVGERHFNDLLAGMRIVDSCVTAAVSPAGAAEPDEDRRARLLQCAPVLSGLLAVWNRNFLGMQTRAVLPYASRLRLLPAYLQQLHMESNGKRVRLDGTAVRYDTGEIVWGAVGTDGQHSFHQLLHQGTAAVASDFVVFASPDHDSLRWPDAAQRHRALVANCFAQAAALAFGTEGPLPAPRGAEPETPCTDLRGALQSASLDAHRELPGNRPSTVILAPSLTPSVLGQLVALYEHQVAAQGALWGINSFDQFGVEHAKTLAAEIIDSLRDAVEFTSSLDPSTVSLLGRYRAALASQP